MHPDRVVRVEQRRDLLGETPVDGEIGGFRAGAQFGEVEPVMEERPKRAVGEAQIIAVVLLRRQRHRDGAHVADAAELRLLVVRLGHDLAAPAEPEPAGGAQRLLQADREPARGRAGRKVGNAVGDHDEPPGPGAAVMRCAREGRGSVGARLQHTQLLPPPAVTRAGRKSEHSSGVDGSPTKLFLLPAEIIRERRHALGRSGAHAAVRRVVEPRRGDICLATQRS